MITADEAREALEVARVAMLCASEAYSNARESMAPTLDALSPKREAWRVALVEFMQAEVTLCAVEDYDCLPTRASFAAYLG